MPEQNTTLLIILIIIGFPLVFGTIWCTISLLISWVSGWHRLAKQYRTDQKPTGKPLSHYWLMLGPASYRGVTTLQPAPEGLYISIMVLFCLGHPTLLIPWRDIRLRGDTGKGILSWATFDLGNPRITTLRLQNSEKTYQILTQFLKTT